MIELIAIYVLGCASLFLVVSAVFGVAIFRVPQGRQLADADLPSVSVLVACRNEERDVSRCMQSLSDLNYPAGRLQVVMVDDRSTDRTAAIIEAFARGRPNWLVADTVHASTRLPGKARGIAEAARHATGEWMFITDADAAVKPDWIRSMLAVASPRTGLIGGTFDVVPSGLIGICERVTSIAAQAFGCASVGLGGETVPPGPCMAIRRDVYEAAGGLEGARFMVAEDAAMWQMGHAAGMETRYCAAPEGCVVVTPVTSPGHLVSQQRRWLAGGFGDGPVFVRPLAIGTALFALSAMVAAFLSVALGDWRGALALAVLAAGMFGLICAMRRRLRLRGIIRLTPIGIPYILALLFWLPLSSFLLPRIKWRGDGYADDYSRQ